MTGLPVRPPPTSPGHPDRVLLTTYTLYSPSVGYRWLPGLGAILSGVEEYEVLQVLTNSPRWPRPIHGQHGLRYLAVLGRTNAGRHVVVILRPAGDHDSVIVAARPMTPTELTEFAAWERPS